MKENKKSPPKRETKSGSWKSKLKQAQRLLPKQKILGFPFDAGFPSKSQGQKYLLMLSTGKRDIAGFNESQEEWSTPAGNYFGIQIVAWHRITEQMNKFSDQVRILIKNKGEIICVERRNKQKSEIFIIGDRTNIGKIISIRSDNKQRLYAVGDKVNYRVPHKPYSKEFSNIKNLLKK